ncbi:MAG: phage tail protein [Pseudomonadota bacterium]
MGIELVVLGFTVSINLAAVAATAAVSVGLSFLSRALFKPERPRLGAFVSERPGERPKAKLNAIDAAPALRYVYGDVRIGGSITERRVNGQNLILQILLNSRPSAGPFKIFLDNTELALSGDMFDFTGLGALTVSDPQVERSASLANTVRVWIGTGAQTSAPDYLLDIEPLLEQSDALNGSTCIWVICSRGNEEDEAQRWPNGQPTVLVEGPFSYLYDPRDPAQDPDDPATWTFSQNQALAVLDMVRHEHCLNAPNTWDPATFSTGADIADLPAAIAGGGTEPLYRVGGVWYTDGATAFEMIEPALEAGMSELVEVDGLWSFIPGRYQAPEISFAEDVIIGEAASFRNEADPAEMFNGVDVQFISAARNWEVQPLERLVDDAALAADQGIPSILPLRLDWVRYSGQAYRIAWRSIQVSRCERQVKAEFDPSAAVLHAGATCALDLSTVFGGVIEFRVTEWRFVFEPVDEQLGTARLTVGVTLDEHAAKIDDYDPDAEPPLADLIGDDPLGPVDPPDVIDVSPVLEVTAGASLIYADIEIAQSDTESTRSYQPRIRQVGQAYQVLSSVPTVDLDPRPATFMVRVGPLVPDVSYDFEVRASSLRGLSAFAVETFSVSTPGQAPAAPVLASDPVGTDHRISFDVPNDFGTEALVISRQEGADPATSETVAVARGSTYEYVSDGPSGVAVTYSAQTLDIWGNQSVSSAVAVHTSP